MIATLFEFSRTYCISICAVLLPFSLVMTFGTLCHIGLGEPWWRVQLSAALACGGSVLMVLHVYTWWVVGVVMVPTYVLPFCAGLFTLVNGLAIRYPRRLQRIFFNTACLNDSY